MMQALNHLLQRQRGHLFPWVPVFLGIGISVYFVWQSEPAIQHYAVAVVVALFAVVIARRNEVAQLLSVGLCLVVMGFCLMGARAHLVAGPVLGFRYYGPVEGRLVAIDQSSAGALRVTLDHVRLSRVDPVQLPTRVRITVEESEIRFPIGARLATTAHLMKPQGPAVPSGFDFRRFAWFRQIGAFGFARAPVLLMEEPPERRTIARLRQELSRRIQADLPGARGAIVAALITGDRSQIPSQVTKDLRASNLAHLLAISGLHMGLLTGVVFAALRLGLAVSPRLGMRVDGKRIAAIGAGIAGFAYLLLSGATVATERAFVMVAVMLVAVLLGRRALSLRTLGLAAIIVLLHRPESLLSPGFQMSFSATLALVVVFSELRDRQLSLGPKWIRPAVALALSSLIAGLATAPFGAAHFNTVSHYGLLANLLAVPMIGAVVMPAAVLAAVLAPFGAEGLGLAIMGAGVEWVLSVAEYVANLPGAQGQVATPPAPVLPLISLGVLVLFLCEGRIRFAGVAPVIIAFLMWQGGVRPFILVADTGGLVGILTPEGRALSRAGTQAFVARVWLEDDGDPVTQAQAAARWDRQFPPAPGADPKLRIADLGTFRIIQVIGKTGAKGLQTCTAGDVVVSTVDLTLAGGCRVYDPKALRHSGSLQISKGGEITSARQLTGGRLWSSD